MGFQQGLSGLAGASKALEAIGNNIANSGTAGYKMQTAQFADIFASSLGGGSAGQVGIGVQVSGIQQSFSQGNITSSSNPLDLAVNGGGLFRMSNQGSITYSRNGQFQLDKSGYLVNAGGLQLTGLGADVVTGAIIPGNYVPLRINNSAIPPQVTTVSEVQFNLDSRSTPPAAMTAGTATGSTAVAGAFPLIYAGGGTLSGTVDGAAFTAVAIPAQTFQSSADVAKAVETAINTGAGGLSGTNASVTASINAGGKLLLTSNSVGSIGSGALGSSVKITAAAGGADTFVLGAALALGPPATNPVETTGLDNFSVANTSSFTSSTAQTVFDSLGNAHTMQLYYAKTSYPGRWQMYTSLDGGAAGAAIPLDFNSAGVLNTLMPITENFTLTNGATTPLKFSLDLTGSTQYGISFGTNQMVQDGFTSGKLSGMTVAPDGTVQGRYSNGKSRNMGQVVLANFNNMSGLQSMGGNQWAETSVSGQPIPGIPGTGNLGLVQSGAIEESNVDMTAELVDMITQQRAYQANAQSIKTLDQIMQTLVNLK